MASLWVAETLLLPRAELAYPEAFVPDMNPRLQSLVLTQIPRYSAGPLIHKLIHFLKLASIQERAIQDIKATNRRGPATLLGLRHIRFEFEPDPRDALEDDVEIELPHDPAAVMDDYSKDFSFFGESNWSSEPSTTSKPSSMSTAAVERHSPRNPSEPRGQTCSCESARPESPHSPSSHESHPSTEATHLLHTWSWNAQTFTLPVWIGFRTADQCTPAVREYMRLLRAQPHLQADPVPASPCHVAAGVPPGELIFSAAWEAILLSGMRDVLAAIKAYRAQTKRAYEELKRTAERDGGRGEVKLGEPHFHWTGRLEVSVEEGSSRYWDWR
ncbi:b30ce2aa-9253-4560-8cf9-607ceb52a1c8 [Thermothielavioides terrestris]|uniref:B30ce2aa-9253-4560-8cf9-607ceb52a1c8 n=1 Tax=Thermothielavioides terrestris TaxID=2587410 RepID=A0A446BDI8_9PEZI|nr:b30ce2aa-9253-4560-8cf9-607ceb52a1c8 [Thermothielavioides terrestris]